MVATPDVLIIGGGAIALAIALQLRQRDITVTVLSRDFAEAASHRAAGMLAPGAEELPPGPMLDLCRRSLARYPDWARKLETLTGRDVGYWPCGILSPRCQIPTDLTAHPTGTWLDAATAHHYQPGLTTAMASGGRSLAIAGAWWYPEDAQVDNRALTQTLRLAAQDAGADLQDGITVQGLVPRQCRIHQVQTTAGDFQAGHYILAAGAWSSDLLPIPIFPKKGQMATVQVPPGHGTDQPLQRVIYGPEGIYIVPRRDGRIVIGATSESVGFTPGLTPAGLDHLFHGACHLYPALREFPVRETWWGFRPCTPDEAPILGPSPWENLTLATGHHRNGILLTPITAELITDYILGNPDPLLTAFSWQRFEGATPPPTGQTPYSLREGSANGSVAPPEPLREQDRQGIAPTIPPQHPNTPIPQHSHPHTPPL
ncbi:glycine oxidase ThiO, partial [Leptolyngbya sp. PCC 6406]|uniref:glycine oxidase ThiO n=1 Tax=Leptolyngbya sp. PCC 6406 TaxID=1173264 RepID=UPI0009071B1B